MAAPSVGGSEACVVRQLSSFYNLLVFIISAAGFVVSIVSRAGTICAFDTCAFLQCCEPSHLTVNIVI